MLNDENLDIIGLNENELLYYTGIEANSDEELIAAAKNLKERIHARIDLHTADFTCSISKNCIVVPSLDLPNIFRATGAGDAWNAGNIFGELLCFANDERLLFASCVAACYISSPNPIHPSLDDVIQFLTSKT